MEIVDARRTRNENMGGHLGARTARKVEGRLAVVLLGCACGALLAWAPSAFAKVLRVGTFNGIPSR